MVIKISFSVIFNKRMRVYITILALTPINQGLYTMDPQFRPNNLPWRSHTK